MRKAQKQTILDLIGGLHQIHEEIKKALEQNNLILAQDMISAAQDSAISLGESIEKIEGEGHITVSCIEEYCELLFRVFEDINKNNVNANKAYKTLRKQLIKIENSVKNDIAVRLEIAFFPYKASMWDSLESIYLAAKADPDCDTYCVPIPYYALNPDRSFGEMHYEGDKYSEDIEITDWREYDFENRRPDAVYIHNPYDDCNFVTSVHPRFYSSNLRKYTDILVYVPYYCTSGVMSEGQSLCPAYIYADYIVIQSPELREYFDANIPDGKFLPLGSPKFDKIIKKCQNPPSLSPEWKERMAGRKVYFYNTSLSGMLADTEAFLKKMNYVFECFEGREDACLLWRPHPLLEDTFDSMRPRYRHIYDALKRMFLDKKLGILDTTPDIADSIALSDVYIGDAGTSVVSLFGVAGKPMFILDNRIYEPPRADSWHGQINTGFDYQEQDSFTITQGNKLYISEPGQYRYRYFGDLSDNRIRQYYTVLRINGMMYAYPLSVQNILVLGDNGVERTIELKKEAADGQMFFWGWKFDKFLILHPLNYPALVRIDTTTEECLYVREHIDVYVREKEGHKITGGSFLSEGRLYLASPVDNRMCMFDINSGEMRVLEIPIQNRCGCHGLVIYKDEIWIRPYAGKVITRWNPHTGKTIEYTGFPNGFRCTRTIDDGDCDEMPFSSMAFYGDYVYFAPLYANMFLRLDIRTGQFAQWHTPLEKAYDEQNVDIGSAFPQWEPQGESGWLYIYSLARQKLYKVHMKTGIWEEVEIHFDMKELQNNSVKFHECSDSLKYACFESVFNPLDSFLEDVTLGNSFERDKQLTAYSKIAENIDGSCGGKVYQYIKEQG